MKCHPCLRKGRGFWLRGNIGVTDFACYPESRMPQAIPFPQSSARHDRRRILNAASIRSIKPPAAGRVDYFDDATPGLSLRITANDVRTWTVFYRMPRGRGE